MTFGAPAFLALLILLPMLLVAAFAWIQWHERARASFGAGPPRRISTLAAFGVLTAAAAVAAFAAARPQLGSRDVTVEARGIDLVIVLDVSQSMYAEDAQPDRIGRAQAELQTLLGRMQGDRVSLVVFAGQPFVRSPLTSDLVALSQLIEGVDEERGLLPPGSDIGAAIRTAVRVLNGGEAAQRAILVVSDGEDFGPGAEPAVSGAVSNGWPVYTAGVGTEQGSAVVDVDVTTGSRTPRIGEDGTPVITRLAEAPLRAIADLGGGRYVALQGESQPLAGLAPELESLGATTFDEDESSQPIERFPIFAWMALALVIEATLLPVIASALAWRRAARLAPLASAGLLVAAICGGGGAGEINERANREHNAGAYDEALQLYATAQAIDPGRGELYYNAGNSYGDKGETNAAIDEAKRALSRFAEDDASAAIAEYALGTHHARAQQFLDAIEAYKRALLADPDDADAKHNLEVVTNELRPSPSPTPPPGFTPEASPSPPNGDGEPGAAPPTPGPGDGEATPGGSPAPGGTPQPGGDGDLSDLPPEELQRRLDEALRGIDEEFTVEEAIRVLDLLNERNRGELAQPPQGGSNRLPDY